MKVTNYEKLRKEIYDSIKSCYEYEDFNLCEWDNESFNSTEENFDWVTHLYKTISVFDIEITIDENLESVMFWNKNHKNKRFDLITFIELKSCKNKLVLSMEISKTIEKIRNGIYKKDE